MEHTLANLKPKQLQFIQELHGNMETEGIDITTCSSFSRSWIKYMSYKYHGMEWAPAWIVKDVSRRDDSKKGHYFIPELFEYSELVVQAKDAMVTS